MRGIFRGDAVARFDVMMVQIKGDLKVIGDAIFKFFAEIENMIGSMFFFPSRSHPLLEFPAPRQQVRRVGPRENRFVRARNADARSEMLQETRF